MGCLNSQPKVEKHLPNPSSVQRQQQMRPAEGRAAEISLTTKQYLKAQALQKAEKKQAQVNKEEVHYQIDVQTDQPMSDLITDYLWQWDTSAKQAECFRINEGKAELAKDGKYYQIISMCLPDRGSVAATLKIEYGAGSKQGIILGVISQTRKNEQFSRGWHEESVAYATWNNGKIGWISMNGIGEKIENRSNLFIPDGGLLNFTVDIQKQKIYFTNFANDQKIVMRLSPSFLSKQLYMYATMTCLGDSVSFL